MGWTTMPMPYEGARAYLDQNIFSYDRPDRKLEVLRSSGSTTASRIISHASTTAPTP